VLGPIVGRRGNEAVLEVASEIEWAQARLTGPTKYAEVAARAGRAPKLPLETIADVYRRYQDTKRTRGLIDFDDLIRLTAQALEQDAEFAATQRWRFRHLFVDEFQDVSRAQLRLLRAWLGDRDDLCVVGDPDQAIYSFAGADVRYLDRFTSEFGGGHTVRLEVNYRSTPEIVAAARAVLSPRERADVRAAGSEGPAPTVTTYADGDAEARGVADALRTAHAGRRWSDLAVLYRVNAQSAPFEEALRRAGIPFRVRGDRAFMDRKEVRDALAELRRNAAAAPNRDFAAHLTDLVVDAADAGDEQRAHREAVVALGHEYLAVASGRGSAGEFEDYLRAALRGQDDGGVAADAVELLTFHRAKGLEWHTVFVTGLERGLVPISHAQGDPDALGEERRLLYVALSRAERELHVSWASTRDRGGTRASTRTASPYLVDIEQALGHDVPATTGPETNRRGARAARERLTAAADAELAPADRQVFDELVAWRRDVSRAAGVPAFVVFDNKVLRSVATARPAGPAELLALSGIGPTKLERYGAAMLEIVGRHAASPAG
jgi:DNA helicase-2/ATP-dependent DNA helicase PcrA